MEVSVPCGGYEITPGRNSKDPSFPVSLRGVLIMSYSSLLEELPPWSLSFQEPRLYLLSCFYFSIIFFGKM